MGAANLYAAVWRLETAHGDPAEGAMLGLRRKDGVVYLDRW